eukprot:SAG22_NODE_445_length_10447_cov_4.063104_2_plen_566_part_00
MNAVSCAVVVLSVPVILLLSVAIVREALNILSLVSGGGAGLVAVTGAPGGPQANVPQPSLRPADRGCGADLDKLRRENSELLRQLEGVRQDLAACRSPPAAGRATAVDPAAPGGGTRYLCAKMRMSKSEEKKSLQKLRCFESPEQQPRPLAVRGNAATPAQSAADALLFPTFLGIGPAKSGSSALIHTLSRHPAIIIGHTPAQVQNGTGSVELEVLTKHRSEVFKQGRQFYDHFFKRKGGSLGESPGAIGEKTPQYAANTLVPYLARALLGPKLKLFYSWRDEVELEASFYVFTSLPRRGLKLDDSLPLLPFARWSELRLQAHIEWKDCRSKAFRGILNAASRAGVEMLHDGSLFSVDDARSAEEEISIRCGEGKNGDGNNINPGSGGHKYRNLNHAHHHFASHLQDNVANLRRWAHVFGEQQIKCIRMQDQIDHPKRVRAESADFLEVDSSLMDLEFTYGACSCACENLMLQPGVLCTPNDNAYGCCFVGRAGVTGMTGNGAPAVKGSVLIKLEESQRELGGEEEVVRMQHQLEVLRRAIDGQHKEDRDAWIRKMCGAGQSLIL